MIALVDFIEMTPDILQRAKAPFAVPVRTLDALHLATAGYLRERHPLTFSPATYDRRMADAAKALDLPLIDLSGLVP